MHEARTAKVPQMLANVRVLISVDLREAEISDFHLIRIIDEEILAIEVTVANTITMKEFHGRTN